MGVLASGHTLQDRYRIDRVIGRGGMGAVYLATHLELRGRVAIKELRPPQPGGDFPPGAVRQFRMEAQILRDLSHPNLPRVYDFLEVEGSYYLVMDFIPGQALDDVLLAEGVLEEERVLGWARQLCDVLHYLHTRRPPIIFRDLKPSNLILTHGDRIKLIDFGIAKFYDVDVGIATQTTARGVLSRGFAAPEQYGGGTDVRSDIYSLGATLYCLLVREMPPESVDVATGRARPVDVRKVRPEISARTARAVEAMMQVERGRRPSTMIAVMEALGFADDRLEVETLEVEAEEWVAPPPVHGLDRPTRAWDRGEGNLPSPRHPLAAAGHELARRPQTLPATPDAATRRAIERSERSVTARPPREIERHRPSAAPNHRAMGRAVLFAACVVLAALIWMATRVPVVTPRPASLKVVTNPTGARVYLNERPLGVAPLTASGLKAGRHVLRFEHDDCASTKQAIVLAEGESQTLSVVLPAAAAAPAPRASETVAVSPEPASPSPRATVAVAPTVTVTPAEVPGPAATWPELRPSPAQPHRAPSPEPTEPVAVQPTRPQPPVESPVVTPPTADVPRPPTGPGPLSTVGGETIIEPGVGVGDLRVGSPLSDLLAPGAVYKQYFEGMELLVVRKNGLGVIPEEGRVKAVVVGPFDAANRERMPMYVTKGGLRLGRSLPEVIAEFGHPHERKRGMHQEWLYPDKGLDLLVGEGFVRIIIVFKPQSAGP